MLLSSWLDSLEMSLARLHHLSPVERREWFDQILARTRKHKADVWRAARSLRPSAVDMLRLY